MLHDVHRLAAHYHWSEDQILRLKLPRRAAYLALIEAEDDQHLFDALGEG
ncbi:hypothetical protein JYJ95_35225 [Corallococcus exiguus]|nr:MULTISPECIES: hypothetical protein [Corallococcus]MBN8471788.1 hypothetical protein [Corallococcus exiguus]